jgi:ribonucleoside-diphosphate reductase beta chain
MEQRLDPPDAGAGLLSYGELYAQWERGHWSVADIDLSEDRIEWARWGERQQRLRLFGLCSFIVGEEKVATELGVIMRACPTEEMRVFLCTQIADEARHAVFFDRYLAEVGGLGGDGGMAARIQAARATVTEDFSRLFDTMLDARIERLVAAPDDLEALVEVITLYHMVLEGMAALTGQQVILAHYEHRGVLRGLVEGMRLISRDEHRHVAFGARFLRDIARDDPRYAAAVRRTLDEAVPIALRTLRPATRGDLGTSAVTLRAFARQALERRMKVIGLPLPSGW